MTALATIGHNRSPFETISERIDDLYNEALLWLDGEPITLQEDADALNTLKDAILKAEKEAEALRKDEVKPLDEAKAEIQDRFNPLIGKTTKITGKTVAAIEAVKAALKPYLLELDRKQRELAEQSRKDAEAMQAIADKAMAERNSANLADNEEAERLAIQAKEAAQLAARDEKAKAHAKGAGRATGLRSVWRAEMTNEREAAAWAWTYCRDELMAFIQGEADKAVRAGKRSIPGFSITEEKVL